MLCTRRSMKSNSQAECIRCPDRFLARRKDRKKEPITQGVRALGLTVRLEDIDDVPEEILAGVEAADVK
jgi:hypothetical protein